jgi:uncharacterized protein YuzE
MKISYDLEVDALYIRLMDEPGAVTTQRLSKDVAVDYAPSGQVAGIEILDATEHVFPSGKNKTVTVENLTPVTA